MAFLDIRGISKSFTAASGTRHVLRNVALSVDEGEFVSIVGAMGSGKTTLLGVAAGLLAPDEGTVHVGGEIVRDVRPDAAFVFQNYSLLPWLTAEENVRLAVAAARPRASIVEQRHRAHDMLARVGLGHARHRRPKQLSGGMRQRVAIARAFAIAPRLLFLDEPFGALDALTRETLQRDLATLCTDAERPVTTVMITNSIDEAILLSDRIVPMIPGPPATLGAPIAVGLPRPRTAAQMTHDDGAAQVRANVIATLAGSTRRGRTARTGETVPALCVAEDTP